MKTEDIKTWQDRTYEDPTLIEEDAKADEIRELRAALKERDAEIERLKDGAHVDGLLRVRYGNQFDTQRAVMQQALEAAEKFRAKCHDGRARSVETYDDMTQLVTALKEALK